LCFAINDLNSFESLSKWYSDSKDHTNGKSIEPLIVIVGTKSDLQSAKRIEKDDALQFCEGHNILYFETSAKSGQSVNDLFQKSCDELLRLIIRKEIKNTLGVERDED